MFWIDGDYAHSIPLAMADPQTIHNYVKNEG